MTQMFDPNQAPPARPSFPTADVADAKSEKKGRKSKAPKTPKTPKTPKAPKGPKSAKRSHTTMIGAAIAFGLVAVLLVLNLGGSDEAPAAVTYVARTKVVKQSNMQISAADLEIAAVSPTAIEVGAVSAATSAEVQSFLTENIIGHYTVAPLTVGEQIHVSDFGSDVELAVELGSDERIVSVRALVGDAAGGVLAVGDHVDVIATVRVDGGLQAYLAVEDVIIAGVRPSESTYSAIASAQSSEDGRNIDPSELLPGEPVPGLYLLQVSVDDALALVTAGSNSALTLAYRTVVADVAAGELVVG